MTKERLIILCIAAIAVAILVSCGLHPAIEDRQREIQEKTIPAPVCEKVNTIVYGREAGCKHER